jgi:TRAP-type uncharacterized transport system fused permease subunit
MTILVWGLIIAVITAIATITSVWWQINKDVNERKKDEKKGLITKPSPNEIQKYGFPLFIPLFVLLIILLYLLFKK